jgi:hypothetical protein
VISDWPALLVAGGRVVVTAGAITTRETFGPVSAITRTGAGVYEVVLRAPGIPGFTAHGAVCIVTAATAARIVQAIPLSATSIAIGAADAAGTPADCNFAFLIMGTERSGVVT